MLPNIQIGATKNPTPQVPSKKTVGGLPQWHVRKEEHSLAESMTSTEGLEHS